MRTVVHKKLNIRGDVIKTYRDEHVFLVRPFVEDIERPCTFMLWGIEETVQFEDPTLRKVK